MSKVYIQSTSCKPGASRMLDLGAPRPDLRSSKCFKFIFGNKIVVILFSCFLNKTILIFKILFLKRWARWARPKTRMMRHLNTNNGVESMHRVIKTIFGLNKGDRFGWVREF